MLNFVLSFLEKSQVEDHKNYLFTEANIISNQLIVEFENLSLSYTRSYYADLVGNFSKEVGSRVIAVNPSNEVLIDAFNEYSYGHYLNNAELSEALTGKPSHGIYDFDAFGKVMYVSVPVEKQGEVLGAVMLASSLEDIYISIGDLKNQFLFLALISVIFTGVVSFIFVEILSSPIEKLTEKVNQVAFGTQEENIKPEGNDEIKVLSNSFETMLFKLNQVDTQRKQLVADVSHELRTPLTSIKLLSASLLGDDYTDPKIYKEFLTDIDSEIDRLNGIIDSLLYLFDLEKDETVLNFTNSTINSLALKVISLLKPLADQKNIRIDLQAEQNVWADFDREKMHQCLSNLIANAIKYNRVGGEIIVQIQEAGNQAKIRVIDNGFGIDEEALPLIFERFYRADKARNRETGGTGLGLSIVQQIVHLHGGHVKVKSVINQGTTFEIEFPKESI